VKLLQSFYTHANSTGGNKHVLLHLRSNRRVCLVTSTSVAHNPRLVKEADALCAAGYTVRVVSCQRVDWLVERDYRLMEQKAWHSVPLSIVRNHPGGFLLFWKSRLRNQIYRRILSKLTLSGGIAEQAFVRIYPELRAEAMREPADLFIAHTPQALPVAAAAARHYGARLGFDAEDYHTGELAASEKHSQAQRLIEYIEARYIRFCDYVSAPSDLVADALERRYGIQRPLVIHNVFPWQERATMDGKIKDRRGSTLSLYWYSQTIGLNRGIQDAIRATGLLSEPVHIHIRGSLNSTTRETLTHLAQDSGVAEQIFFYPAVPPEELLSRTAEHDVGLALEQPVTDNRCFTITNKIFFYMLAGMAIAASDVPGQRVIMQACPHVGCLYPPGDYHALALHLQNWLNNPEELATCKQVALKAARVRWNWESEQRAFLDQIDRIFQHYR